MLKLGARRSGQPTNHVMISEAVVRESSKENSTTLEAPDFVKTEDARIGRSYSKETVVMRKSFVRRIQGPAGIALPTEQLQMATTNPGAGRAGQAGSLMGFWLRSR